jgi:hypothetical protein
VSAALEELAAAPERATRKPKRKQPTQRTLEYLRELGCLEVAVVEKWNPHARIRQDLFGCIDVLAIGADGTTIAVQACSGSGGDAAERVRKIQDSDAVGAMRKAGWSIYVHAWRKNSQGRWVLREVDLS